MAQKRAARRGRKPAAGSEDSVELGRKGEPMERRPSKKPSPEEADGSQSNQLQNGGEATDEETAARALAAMAAAGDGPTKAAKPSAPPRPAAAEPSEEEEDGVTSHRQVEVAKNLPQSAKNPASRKENEEESAKAPGPNPLPKRKRASGSTTRSQQPKVPAPAQQRGKESEQLMVSDKPKSKKFKRATAQEGAKKQAEEELNMSRTEKCNVQTMHKDKPKSKKIKQAPEKEGAKKHQILAAVADDGDKQAEGELNMSQAEKCDGQDRSFEEKCAMYPLVGQEVKRLAGEHPGLKSLFTELVDGKIVLSMEKELNKVAWKELKIQIEMDTKVQAPKARVRKELVSLLALVSKKA